MYCLVFDLGEDRRSLFDVGKDRLVLDRIGWGRYVIYVSIIPLPLTSITYLSKQYIAIFISSSICIAVLRGESSLNKGPNTLPPALLTALAATTKAFQCHEPVYDTLTPIHVWIRAYVTEPNGPLLTGQILEKKIANAILSTTQNDAIVISERKLRNSVDIGEIEQRKIRLFMKINTHLFETFYNGEYPRNKMIITMNKIELFKLLSLRVMDSLSKAFKKLKKLNDVESKVSNKIDQINDCDVEYKKYLRRNKMNKKATQQLLRKIFPEREIVSTETYVFS